MGVCLCVCVYVYVYVIMLNSQSNFDQIFYWSDGFKVFFLCCKYNNNLELLPNTYLCVANVIHCTTHKILLTRFKCLFFINVPKFMTKSMKIIGLMSAYLHLHSAMIYIRYWLLHVIDITNLVRNQPRFVNVICK